MVRCGNGEMGLRPNSLVIDKLIVREQQYEAKTVEWLANETGAKIAVIGTMANAFPGADTFEKFSEHNIKALLQAVGK